jgi:glycogen synthase
MLINFYIAKNFDYKYIDNIYDLISSIDSSKLTVLTSDYEGLGLPPLECMSRGVIPIIRSCEGPNTYAVDNYNSIILPSNASNNEYLDTVSSLLGNALLLKQLSSNAALTAKKFRRNNFLENFSNELISFYNNA